ncbi:hypothetical protein CANARDRAFT_53198 [[Candida] arabinofermentans NRRL YB-2248]|uniref:Uncharacterized protein n=1 Tax=[Candida] arabinofermentans NRRL YB-2248 TaxID=983967 RepID=A0A1E4T7X3_9ASCO|nr:hypothetical protein CANARDRAFT_53198 [[Candida] arabinofermentans NRRL YB-2248]
MSKIFLNSTFKVFKLQYIPDAQGSVIDRICYDELQYNPEIDLIRKKLVNTILVEELYKGHDFIRGSSLIPSTSRLYNNGRKDAKEIPDFGEVYSQLQIRVKINQLEHSDRVLKIGHFRFKLPKIIPAQLLILIETEPGVILVLTKIQPKLLSVIVDHFINSLGCLMNSLNLPSSLLKELLNETVKGVESNRVGDLELSFNGIPTSNGTLNSLLINVQHQDIGKFDDGESFVESLYDHLRKQTAVDFNQLSLRKIRCRLFFMMSEGKIRFTSDMSFLPDPQSYDDDRPTIWVVMFQLCDLCK